MGPRLHEKSGKVMLSRAQTQGGMEDGGHLSSVSLTSSPTLTPRPLRKFQSLVSDGFDNGG